MVKQRGFTLGRLPAAAGIAIVLAVLALVVFVVYEIYLVVKKVEAGISFAASLNPFQSVDSATSVAQTLANKIP